MTSPSESTKPITIVVMGPTGVGKSTFINRASGSNLTVSGGIASCTKDVAASDAFDVDGKTVTLIDTPGFNDTKISRSSLLRRIVTFLTKTYEKGRVPNAIIYLHRISDLRFGGIMRQDFEAFRKIVGVDSEKRIILTTTMWCDVKEEIGRKRELELKADDRFFGEVCKNGAVMVRHDDTRERALEIVRVAMGYPPGKLAVQDETVDKKLSFPETSPARCLRRDFEDQVNKQKKELLELQQQVDELKKSKLKDENDRLELEEIRRERDSARNHLLRIQKEIENLSSVNEEGSREQEAAFRKMEEEMKRREVEIERERLEAREREQHLQQHIQEHGKKAEEAIARINQQQDQIQKLRVVLEEQADEQDENRKTLIEGYQRQLIGMKDELMKTGSPAHGDIDSRMERIQQAVAAEVEKRIRSVVEVQQKDLEKKQESLESDLRKSYTEQQAQLFQETDARLNEINKMQNSELEMLRRELGNAQKIFEEKEEAISQLTERLASLEQRIKANQVTVGDERSGPGEGGKRALALAGLSERDVRDFAFFFGNAFALGFEKGKFNKE